MENLLLSAARLSISPVIEDDGFFDYGIHFPDAVELKSVTAFAPSSWAHSTKELARKAVWKQIDKERQREGKPTWGIGNGINTDETMKTKVDARTQGVYRKCLLKAVWTQSRRARMPDNDDDPTCTGGTEEENLRHLWAVPAMGGHPRETLSEYGYDNLPVVWEYYRRTFLLLLRIYRV